MASFAIYGLAAVAEIAGCFAFWAWLRLGKSVYWILPGVMFLVNFAVLLTRVESIFAGRLNLKKFVTDSSVLNLLALHRSI